MLKETFSLHAAAEQAYREYPEIRETTLFAYRHDIVDKKQDALLHQGKKVFDKFLSSNILEHSPRSGSSVTHYTNASNKEDACFLLTFDSEYGCFPNRERKNELDHFMFYHELGHIVTYSGRHGSNPVNECGADSYALLRYLKESNNDLVLPHTMIWHRAAEAIHSNNTSHLTIPCLEILTKEAELAIKKPHERQHQFWLDEFLNDHTLIDDLAFDKAPNVYDLQQLTDTYAPFKNRLYCDLTDATCKALAETALSTQHKFSFHIGARFFQPLLHPDGININCHTVGAQKSVRLDNATRSKLGQAFIERALHFRDYKIAHEFTIDIEHYAAGNTRSNRFFQPLLSI